MPDEWPRRSWARSAVRVRSSWAAHVRTGPQPPRDPLHFTTRVFFVKTKNRDPLHDGASAICLSLCGLRRPPPPPPPPYGSCRARGPSSGSSPATSTRYSHPFSSLPCCAKPKSQTLAYLLVPPPVRLVSTILPSN